jgi:cell division protein FtsQ
MRKGKAAKTSVLRRVRAALGFGGGLQPSAVFKSRLLRSGLLMAVLGTAWWSVREVALQAEVFRLSQDGDWLTVEGVASGDETELRALFDPDKGHSLAKLDIVERRQQLLVIQWVKEASVSKVWPDGVRVVVRERAPVALVPISGAATVRTIDADGVLLAYNSLGRDGLPVLTGIDAEMELGARKDRVEFFMAVMDACSVQRFSERVSEVNVADLANAIVLAKHEGRLVQLELGKEHLRHRVEMFLNGVDGWQSALGPVKAVNLRLEGQIPVVLDLDQDKKS